MHRTLIVGATRGLGASLVKQYAAKPSTQVYATSRHQSATPEGFPQDVKWIAGIDLMDSSVGSSLVQKLQGEKPFDSVYITAGMFMTEDFSAEKGPNWNDEVTMYTTSSIAPVFIVHALAHAGLLATTTASSFAKVILVSSEAGSITLRHESEGGGNYAHHASKAALNMAGRLLSLDLKEKGVVVSIVHPGFMRTDMTRGVGFDKYWDAGGAVTPDEAAKRLLDWTANLNMSKSGEFWAPGGPGDIGTAEPVLGSDLTTPLRLPW